MPRVRLGILLLGTILVFASCTRFDVRVDSILSPAKVRGNTYVIFPGMKDVAPNDLQFVEFSNYVKKALSSRGFQEATSFQNGDVAIFLRYGIGKPESIPYSFSVPVYGQVGGGTSTFNASTYGSGGFSSMTGTISSLPHLGVVGMQSFSGVHVRYLRFMTLEGIDVKRFQKTNKVFPLWKTTVTSAGKSGDLRRVFPILVGASLPYIGTNTGKQIDINISEKDQKVKFVKGLSDRP